MNEEQIKQLTTLRDAAAKQHAANPSPGWSAALCAQLNSAVTNAQADAQWRAEQQPRTTNEEQRTKNNEQRTQP